MDYGPDALSQVDLGMSNRNASSYFELPLKFDRRKILFGGAAILLVGCGASISEYQQFAQAGTAYAAALDKLLEATGAILLDASSERLLANDTNSDVQEDTKRYDRITDLDERWLVLLRRMRSHTSLLKRYFDTLYELATSDAPAKAQAAAAKIGTELANLGVLFRTAPPTAGQVFGKVGEIVIKAQIRGALRAELETREKTIRSEMKIQEELLKFLEIKLTEDLKQVQSIKSDRYLRTPYIALQPVEKSEGWVEKRKEIRLITFRIDELDKAQKAASSLLEAFEALLQNDLTPARAAELLADIEAFLKLTQRLNA
ncbi:hypothetical protein [Gloeobacter violaceus]|uniref:Glr1710 protein n=1 Tax=Gloeobacter violaceus (strain ATCC 29082 / PCC 7421) TaxID=251221 RepID=Q7NJX1_GLOVI|nr:hypothetical protein [Gloeobacter violaceus]BAC89651.1 glr1710 [Gloeobacter violaceus PCC 7421]